MPLDEVGRLSWSLRLHIWHWKDPIFGVAKGVDESGALLLQQDNKTIAIHAGDVSLRIQS